MPNLAQQAACIQRRYAQFAVSLPKHNRLVIVGWVKPSARSCPYHFRLVYEQRHRPVVHILSPELQQGDSGQKPPHLYGDESLCLYLPGTWEYSDYEWLSDTIIPWISLWLYYYEDWLVNGNIWNGGGIHPEPTQDWSAQMKIRPSQR